MNIRYLSFSFFTVLALLLSSNMKAEIDETIVAASLFPVSIDDSANSINVISAEDIENTPHLNLADLLRDLPGISVSQSGVLGSQIQVRVRGSEANHLLVLVDGVEVNNASQNDEFNWGNIIPTDIEKIEVIRGPQSSMYGTDAMAGVINIITQKGKNRDKGYIDFQYGAYNTEQYRAGLAGGSDKLYYSYDGSYLNQDGFSATKGSTDTDGLLNKTFTANFGGTANSDTTTWNYFFTKI